MQDSEKEKCKTCSLLHLLLTCLGDLASYESSILCKKGIHNLLLCMQDLRPLVYPLTQVLLGMVRLVPTPRYFPLRLRCIRALLSLSRAVGQFIPLSPVLLEMLQWRELSQRPQAGAGGMPDMALQLRVSKNSLKIPAFQEEVVSQVGCHCSVICCKKPQAGPGTPPDVAL